jgi:signal transduction histidine kinase
MIEAEILIVDDMPEALSALSAMLKARGCRVTAVASGRQGIEAALRSPPDLILLDIDMPEMDGLEVCAQLKAEEKLKDIPVIFLSALTDTRDKLAAFKAGGVDYIAKPFQRQEVHARVEAQLELRRRQEQLEESLAKLSQLEQLRDSLTHMIVHDMRSPLMAVGGYLKMLETYESGGLSGEGRSYVAQAREGVARLTRMAADMLAVSKLEAGKLELKLETCDLVELAQRAARGAEAQVEGKTVQFTTELKSLGARVDLELVGRVLENLLNNALKFAPQGTTVQVRLTGREGEGHIEVVDQGPGIAGKHHEAIFQKFGQLEGDKKRRGTGLGLAFCKLAVEAHGGRIGVRSEPGKGSAFWFTLPLDRR